MDAIQIYEKKRNTGFEPGTTWSEGANCIILNALCEGIMHPKFRCGYYSRCRHYLRNRLHDRTS